MEEILKQILNKLNDLENGQKELKNKFDNLENKVHVMNDGISQGFQLALVHFNDISKKLDRHSAKVEKVVAIMKDLEYRVEDLETQKV